MIIKLTKEQRAMQAEFRTFVNNNIIPYAEQNDREERIPRDIINKLSEKKYLGSMIPKEYGGAEMEMVTIGILNEEFGRGCSSVRSLLTVHGMVALAILRWGTEEQRKQLLPKMATGEIIGAFGLTEPDIGSDAKNIRTKAVLRDNKYIINGQKKWITMGQVANLFLIFARYEDKVTAFLVERDTLGFSTKPITGMLGARASMIAEISMENCQIPKENIIGRQGTGMTHIALSSLEYGRYTVAWGCVGIGQACLEESINYSRERKQFNVPLSHHQLIQKMIAEMAIDVKAARLMCYNAGYLKDEKEPDSIMETWAAKYYASRMATKVAADAVQIHGANGCQRKYPVERYYRDAKINEIIEGTTQIHELLIASNAFRSY